MSKPSYYKGFNTLIKNKFTPEQQLTILEFQIFRYLYRYKNKKGIEDLKKVRWYLNRLINKINKLTQDEPNH